MSGCWLCGDGRFVLLDGPGGRPVERCSGCGMFLHPRREGGEGGVEAVEPAEASRRLSIHRALLDHMERTCGRGRLVDVGCGSGEFMKLAAGRGWRVKGVDIFPGACRLAREKGLDVFQGTLEEARFGAGEFDMAALWDVLDMVRQPGATLKEVARVLRPGGTLFARVRNAPFHLAAWRLGRALRLGPLKALPVMHRHGFSMPTLLRALSDAGFRDAAAVRSPLGSIESYASGISRPWRLASAAARVLAPTAMQPSLNVACRKPHPRPRVLQLITRLEPGGSSENVVLSCMGLRGSGWDVSIGAGPSEASSAELEAAAVPVVTIPSLRRAPGLAADLAAFGELLGLIRAWRPDILHTHCSKAGFLGRWAAAACRPRPRVVHTPHGHVFYGYFGALASAGYLALERLTGIVTDSFVALTEAEMKESLERGVGKPAQWTVIRSGVRPPGPVPGRDEARRRLPGLAGLEAGVPIVGCVARLAPVKGVGVLVDAAAMLESSRGGPSGAAGSRQGPAPHFLIVGGGPDEAQLKRRAEGLGLAGRISFAGYQPAVEPFMAAMDVYAQPSLNEGMGKSLVLAQAMGLPVVASRVCGIPEVVRDGETGILVPPGDPAALAGALRRLLDDEPLRRKLGAAGPAWIKTADWTGQPAFSVEAMVAGLEKLYSGLSRPEGEAPEDKLARLAWFIAAWAVQTRADRP